LSACNLIEQQSAAGGECMNTFMAGPFHFRYHQACGRSEARLTRRYHARSWEAYDASKYDAALLFGLMIAR